MKLLKRVLLALASQIKDDDVKLPKKRAVTPKIQDNNQAISNGVVNEKSNSGMRSKGNAGKTVKRGTTAKRKS